MNLLEQYIMGSLYIHNTNVYCENIKLVLREIGTNASGLYFSHFFFSQIVFVFYITVSPAVIADGQSSNQYNSIYLYAGTQALHIFSPCRSLASALSSKLIPPSFVEDPDLLLFDFDTQICLQVRLLAHRRAVRCYRRC